MNDLIKAFVGMIQIKKLIALALTITFIVLALYGVIDAVSFMSVFTIIVGFYFGQSTANDSKK